MTLKHHALTDFSNSCRPFRMWVWEMIFVPFCEKFTCTNHFCIAKIFLSNVILNCISFIFRKQLPLFFGTAVYLKESELSSQLKIRWKTKVNWEFHLIFNRKDNTDSFECINFCSKKEQQLIPGVNISFFERPSRREEFQESELPGKGFCL